jgi:hypothetical protein
MAFFYLKLHRGDSIGGGTGRDHALRAGPSRLRHDALCLETEEGGSADGRWQRSCGRSLRE